MKRFQFPLLVSLCVSFLLLTISCQREEFNLVENSDDFFFLRNKGADMPVWVQGNTQSKTFVLVLHGGPGGSSFIIKEFFTEFIDPLEASYGVVYWEQRSSGSSQGRYSTSTLQPENYVDDLEKLIVLLKDKYGQDIKLFLTGISWGGYLGSAYLSKGNNQENIKGWISIVGTNSFAHIANAGRRKLNFYAQQQLNLGQNIGDWEEILEWTNSLDTIVVKDDFLKGNQYAFEAELLMEDSLIEEIEAADLGEQLGFVFTSPFSSNAWLSNLKGIRKSQLLDILITEDIDVGPIQIPSLFIGSKYDFIVPEEVVRAQFENIGSEEREFYLFENSGHAVLGHETSKLNRVIADFVEKYR